MPSKLYIANTSKQHVDFTYRLRDEKKIDQTKTPTNREGDLILEKNYRTEKILVGVQILVGGGKLSEKQIACIIDQYADKGLRDSTQISRLQEYSGLCYRLDRPVELEKVHLFFEQNDRHLNERAEDRREETAAAFAQGMQNRAHELHVPLARTEMEIVEDTKGGATSRVANGFEMVTEGHAPRRGNGRSGRRGSRTNA